MSNSTLTLLSVVNLASTHMDLLPLSDVGGYKNEPALSLCNDVMSDLLMSPNDWKFNRTEMSMFVTCPNRQDYQFGGATAFTLGSTSSGVGIQLASATTPGISESGTTVTVNTLEQHRFSVGDTVYMTGNALSAYNSTFTDTGAVTSWSGGWAITAVPTSTQFRFTHASSGLATSGAPGITNLGWVQSASMVEMNNNSSPQNIRQLISYRELPVFGRVAIPEKVAVMKDNGDGTIQIRLWYVPGSTVWGVKLVYQATPPLKTSLSDTWAPFPDSYSAVLRQAFLYRAYRYLNSPRAELEYQKLQQEIVKAQGDDDAEQTSVYVFPEEPLMDSWWF